MNIGSILNVMLLQMSIHYDKNVSYLHAKRLELWLGMCTIIICWKQNPGKRSYPMSGHSMLCNILLKMSVMHLSVLLWLMLSALFSKRDSKDLLHTHTHTDINRGRHGQIPKLAVRHRFRLIQLYRHENGGHRETEFKSELTLGQTIQRESPLLFFLMWQERIIGDWVYLNAFRPVEGPVSLLFPIPPRGQICPLSVTKVNSQHCVVSFLTFGMLCMFREKAVRNLRPFKT